MLLASGFRLLGHQVDIPEETLPVVIVLIAIALLAIIMAFVSAGRATSAKRREKIAVRTAEDLSRQAAVLLRLDPEVVLTVLRRGEIITPDTIRRELAERGAN